MNTTSTPPIPSAPLFVSMTLMAWETYNTRLFKLIDELPEEVLTREVAPGRNTGIYLFGHLIAIHDNLIPMFGLGNNLFPEWGKIFVDTPDKSGQVFPPLPVLKKSGRDGYDFLTARFNKMTTEDWFTKHAAVSEDAFRKEPHRNKLNVVINRTNHLSYHLGQIALLKAGR